MEDTPLSLAPAGAVDGSHAGKLTLELSTLYDELAPGLLRYAAGISHDYDLASEGVQETFFRYFLHRRQALEIQHPKAWMFRVLRNVIFDLLKERSAVSGIDFEMANELPAAGPNLAEVVELAHLKARLPEFLSPREMQCIQLRSKGLQYEEIAAVLNLTSGRVGAILSGATDKLRRVLG